MIGWLLVAGGGAFLLYTFLGYPALLFVARLFVGGRRAEPVTIPDADLPNVSILVSLYNEAHQVESLIRNLLDVDYPSERVQIILVSDGSTDRTDQLIVPWTDRGVVHRRLESRRGKTEAENLGMEDATGEIVIHTDASSRLYPDAVRKLVMAFADPSVAVASGTDESVSDLGEQVNSGEAQYVSYEMKVRDLETQTGGIVGASGSLYAARREISSVRLAPQFSRDFASALLAQERGMIAVSVPEARCRVPRTRSLNREFHRKTRTAAGGMATLLAWWRDMVPIPDPVFAWKLASHKLARWLAPVAMLVLSAGLLVLAFDHTWARVIVAAGLVSLMAGVVGWRASTRFPRLPGIIALPAFTLVANLACLRGMGRVFVGRADRIWEPTRRETAPTSGS